MQSFHSLILLTENTAIIYGSIYLNVLLCCSLARQGAQRQETPFSYILARKKISHVICIFYLSKTVISPIWHPYLNIPNRRNLGTHCELSQPSQLKLQTNMKINKLVFTLGTQTQSLMYFRAY